MNFECDESIVVIAVVVVVGSVVDAHVAVDDDFGVAFAVCDVWVASVVVDTRFADFAVKIFTMNYELDSVTKKRMQNLLGAKTYLT